ncbi:MAG: tetratricopeptide repeat protein [Acidobacteria bacterium]|nr:tetratricopeptide repeat protein [Acidobacteriota bacterium]
MRAKLLLSALLLIAPPRGGAGVVAQEGRDDARAAVSRGNEKYARAEYEAAIAEYRRVPRKAGETYARALYNIGVCHYELWRTEEAIAFYRRAAEALGVALEDSGRWAEAREAYGRVEAAARGRHAPALYRLGLLAAREGDYDAAATLFRHAIARSEGQFPESHNNLGVMLALKGRLRDAEREFESAVRKSGGAFDLAARNLKLCRSMLDGGAKAQLTSLKVVQNAAAPVE